MGLFSKLKGMMKHDGAKGQDPASTPGGMPPAPNNQQPTQVIPPAEGTPPVQPTQPGDNSQPVDQQPPTEPMPVTPTTPSTIEPPASPGSDSDQIQ